MIEALKFKFKSKGPTSKKNRIIHLCIDTTTVILIVGVFFFARHLRRLMPEPAQKTPIATAASAALTVSNTATPATLAATPDTAPATEVPAAAQTAPTTSASASAPVAAAGTSFPPVEIPGSSNNAGANLAGWIKPDNKPAAAAPATQAPAQTGSSSSLAVASSPAKADTIQPDAQPAAGSTTDSASAKSAPVSMGDSLMSVLTPSAKGETVQPEMQPAKAWAMTIPVARQPLKIQAPVVHDAPPLTDDQKRAKAAQAGCDYVLGLAAKDPDIYGFSPNEPIAEAKLGEPIHVYTIGSTDRRNYQPGQPLKPILKAMNRWIYPVELGNRIRFMVPVEGTDGDYAAGTSSRSLAMVYEKILARWPTSDGFHPELILNGGIDTYFFTIPELPEPNLTDTSEMFDFNPNLSPASVILASWQ